LFKHLLVPTDGSQMADTAIERAVVFAKSSGAQITFFHVQESFYGRTDVALFGEGFAINPDLGESFAKANRERAATILKAATSQAEAAGVPCSSSTAVHPVTYEAILAAARDNNCDLIFMASHGRRGLAGLLIGSETQRVLTHSKLPVLVFPGQGRAEWVHGPNRSCSRDRATSPADGG
jgi:nucleotide-binding universal stress UspA family protein